MSESIILLNPGFTWSDNFEVFGQRVDSAPVFYLKRKKDGRCLKIEYTESPVFYDNLEDYFKEAAGETN